MLAWSDNVEFAKRLLTVKGVDDIEVVNNSDKTVSVIGRKSSLLVPGEVLTIVLHLDITGNVVSSDMFALSQGKYLIAPTRTYYPSKKRVRIPVDVESCVGRKPYWTQYDLFYSRPR